MGIQVFEITGGGASFGRETTSKTRRFQVVSDVLLRDVDVLLLPGIPKPYDPHPAGGAWVDTVDPEEDEDDPYTWIVEVKYTSQIDDENPLAEPAKIAFRWEKVREITFFDGEGDPLLNTAGDLIEGVERDVSRLVISVKKNMRRVPSWIDAYNDTVNVDTVRLRGRRFRKETLKFDGLTLPEDEKTKNDVTYIPVQFELHHKRGGWKEWFLNRGFNELVTEKEDGKKRQRLEKIFVNPEGEVPNEPVFLDKKGRTFRDRKGRLRAPKPEEVIILKKLLYEKLPYSTLPTR